MTYSSSASFIFPIQLLKRQVIQIHTIQSPHIEPKLEILGRIKSLTNGRPALAAELMRRAHPMEFVAGQILEAFENNVMDERVDPVIVVLGRKFLAAKIGIVEKGALAWGGRGMTDLSADATVTGGDLTGKGLCFDRVGHGAAVTTSVVYLELAFLTIFEGNPRAGWSRIGGWILGTVGPVVGYSQFSSTI